MRMAGVPRLTKRQIQCTMLAGRGLTEADIAERLGLATQTVKTHLQVARRAYSVDRTIQLVMRALADGLISLDDLL